MESVVRDFEKEQILYLDPEKQMLKEDYQEKQFEDEMEL